MLPEGRQRGDRGLGAGKHEQSFLLVLLIGSRFQNKNKIKQNNNNKQGKFETLSRGGWRAKLLTKEDDTILYSHNIFVESIHVILGSGDGSLKLTSLHHLRASKLQAHFERELGGSHGLLASIIWASKRGGRLQNWLGLESSFDWTRDSITWFDASKILDSHGENAR